MRRWPLIVWLTVVWVMLWGTFTLPTVLAGLVVAGAVALAFPAPPIATDLTVRPLRLLQLLGFLAVDMVVSGSRLGWIVLRHGPRTRSGIVEVRMLVDSDHLTVMVANAVSLVPGTFTLEIDRASRLCYVHALPMTGRDGAAAVRAEVRDLELRVVRALGSEAEVARVASRAGEEVR